MPDEQTDLLGIPVPSENKLFLTIIIIHIALALVCLISGLIAMLSDKNTKGHSKAGNIYFWFILAMFLTIIPLTIMRWPHNTHLFLIGIFSFGFVYTGRKYARTRSKNWPRFHTICMGASYILLLTGFYVDNGKNLPFWNKLPQIVFWIFPTIIGIPIILYVLKKHPLNKVD